jgi:hypothetical protein
LGLNFQNLITYSNEPQLELKIKMLGKYPAGSGSNSKTRIGIGSQIGIGIYFFSKKI